MEKLIVFALLLMTMVPLVIATKRSKKGKSGKAALVTNICMFFALGIGIIIALPLSASVCPFSSKLYFRSKTRYGTSRW